MCLCEHSKSGSQFVLARRQNNMIEKKEVEILRKRMSVLEFLFAILLSSFITFVYGVTQIFNIEWYPRPLIFQGLQFFGISFLTLNFILFVVNTAEKVGPKFSSLWSQWKAQTLLMKVVILLGLPSSLIGIYQTGQFIFDLILKVT